MPTVYSGPAAAPINTTLSASNGAHQLVIRAWDSTGANWKPDYRNYGFQRRCRSSLRSASVHFDQRASHASLDRNGL